MRVAAALLAITALSFFVFPGHTYLQQDTQIYVPILEHQWSGVLSQDLLVQHPHVNFTFYDELTNALRWLTRMPLEYVLAAEQLFFRFCGFAGVLLIARSFNLCARDSIVLTAIFAVGADIAAPAVLTIEYEPTPRAFAVPLVFLSLGLLLRGRDWQSGIAGAAAILLHAPTVWPLGIAVIALAFVRHRAALALLPMFTAGIAIFAIGHAQSVAEPQKLLARLDTGQETLQRMRASYAYVSTWWSAWAWQYLLYAAIAIAGLWQVRAAVEVRTAMTALVAAGLLSVPVSWLFLEHWHFAAVPQIQPARALLFVTATAILCASAAACASRKLPEAFSWFFFPLFMASHRSFFSWPGARVFLVVNVCAIFLAWSHSRIFAAALLAPAMLLAAQILPYRNIQTPDLASLADWARNRTPENAVFVFGNASRDRSPGWFRAKALRAVYVDWKGGGQVNYLHDFGQEWWRRWQAINSGEMPQGVDFEVVRKPLQNLGNPVYRNESYLVYRLPRAI